MNFDDDFLSCRVDFSPDYSKIKIRGFIKNPAYYSKIALSAANPMDRMTNYSGSGLPFPCATIAFENTPNHALIDSSGKINSVFLYPNSFYAQNGKDKIISSIFFDATSINGDNTVHRYELIDRCVLRTLANRNARKGPEFYAAKDYLLPIDTAENVMRVYAKVKVENDIG